MYWVSILRNISVWIILLPLFTGLYMYKILDRDSKLILLVVIGGTLPQILRPFFYDTTILNILYNIYTPFEFIVYWLLFKDKIFRLVLKRIIKLTIIVFFILSFFLISRFGITHRFLSEWVVFNNIIQITWIYLCLMEYYYSDEEFIEKSKPFYWFIIGITVYASCTVVYYSLLSFIKNNPNNQYQIIVIIQNLFNIFL